jgi:hypothetical protein
MAGPVTAEVFESQARTLLRQLKAEGFEIQVGAPSHCSKRRSVGWSRTVRGSSLRSRSRYA